MHPEATATCLINELMKTLGPCIDPLLGSFLWSWNMPLVYGLTLTWQMRNRRGREEPMLQRSRESTQAASVSENVLPEHSLHLQTEMALTEFFSSSCRTLIKLVLFFCRVAFYPKAVPFYWRISPPVTPTRNCFELSSSSIWVPCEHFSIGESKGELTSISKCFEPSIY